MERTLISEYERKHQISRYGATGHKSLPDILSHVIALSPRSIVDYGCGQSDLIFALAGRIPLERFARFDPAIPEFADKPKGRFDLLVSVDVLEHVPDGEIDVVAAEMAAMATDAILIIDTGPATVTLSDGRNAHVSQHGGDWWADRLRPHFPSLRPFRVGRKRRAGFKTFDAELPLPARYYVELRESILRSVRRIRERVQRTAGVL
jgi:hypothetical protein